MTVRTARAGSVTVISASSSSILQFGDIGSFHAVSHALAVQRELDHTIGGEVHFASYPIFRLALPPEAAEVEEQLPGAMKFTASAGPGGQYIDVGSVHVIAVAAASLIEVGNTGETFAETRIKHFRQFARPPAGGGGERQIRHDRPYRRQGRTGS